MMIKVKRISGYLWLLCLLLFIAVSPARASTGAATGEAVWYEKDIHGQPVIHLYFFWSKKRPHCLKARPDVLDIQDELP